MQLAVQNYKKKIEKKTYFGKNIKKNLLFAFCEFLVV